MSLVSDKSQFAKIISTYYIIIVKYTIISIKKNTKTEKIAGFLHEYVMFLYLEKKKRFGKNSLYL